MIDSTIIAERQGPVGEVWERARVEGNWLVCQLRGSGPKKDKVPIHPRTLRAIGATAAAALTFEHAVGHALRLNARQPTAPGCAGRCHVGYLPRPGSTLVGGDLDGVLELPAWVPEWSTYHEVSPSGVGIRVLMARGPATPAIHQEVAGVGFFASEGRFFTVTMAGGRDEIVAAPALQQEFIARSQKEAEVEQAAAAGAGPEARWFYRLPPKVREREVERMLSHLTDPRFGDYDDRWLRISMAVFSATEGMGFDVWDRWCRQLPGYDRAGNEVKWRLCHLHPRSISVGTLVHHARLEGYTPPFPPHEAASLALARRLGPDPHKITSTLTAAGRRHAMRRLLRSS